MPNPDMDAPQVLSPNNDELIADQAYVAPATYYNDVLAAQAESIAGQFKKGWKTSEFHSTVFTFGVVLANKFFDLDLDGTELGSLVAANVSYVLGRSGLKVGRVRALAKWL